jgi:xylulokinase
MTAILAYDLGTGGCKASLFSEQGDTLASVFQAYDTFYPHAGWHEQRPADWWTAIVASTRALVTTSGVDPASIRCMALSGQSLAVVPLDQAGHLLRDTVPIWSDTRPTEQVEQFFTHVDADAWYLATGNGFSRATYSVFKVMWYRDHEPHMFERIRTILGSKDYINYRLTGALATDHSYASGSGIYHLKQRSYDQQFMAASGLSPDLFPPIAESSTSLGHLTSAAAEALGLPPSVEVFCGGVDNSCMALGAGNSRQGRLYLSLGSSAWLAVSSREPVVDVNIRPFVFAHVIPHMFTSATSIFAAGSSFRWLRDVVCSGVKEQAQRDGRDAYDLLTDMALQSPVGANGIFFNPSLAGGSAAYPNPNIHGAFLGLELRHTQSDLIRAVLEGITFDLAIMYRKLAQLVPLEDPILMVGGGSNSLAWRQMFADVFGRPFARARIGQDAASLGAAAIAAVGSGLWSDYAPIERLIEADSIETPNAVQTARYGVILGIYEQTWSYLSGLADLLGQL